MWERCFLHIQPASCCDFRVFQVKEWSAVGSHISLFICQYPPPPPHLPTRSPTTAPRWGFYSNPIPNILLGPPWDKAYWGMLVYPYELNGPQLYQDHPAGQGCSVRGYDVAKLARHVHAHVLRCARMHTHCLSFSPTLTYDKTPTLKGHMHPYFTPSSCHLQIVYGPHVKYHFNTFLKKNYFPPRLSWSSLTG